MTEVRFVDVTIRDGQLSVWAANMTLGMMIKPAEYIDEAGFDAIECGWGNPEKNMPIHFENPFEGYRLLSKRFKKTPMRFHGGGLQSFKPGPSIMRSLGYRIAANIGAEQTRISDPWNRVRVWERRVADAREAGLKPIVNLAFSISPRHTDAYYAERARGAASLKPYRICLKDVDGLLTVDRVRTLVPVIMENAPGIEFELHGHDTTGLATSVALECVKLGIHIINSTIPPLSYGGAQPSVHCLARNARAMGYETNINEEALKPVTEYWTAVAKQEGFPIGTPVEYDSRQYLHQMPGAMKNNLRRQLAEVGYEHAMEEVLDEAGRVKAELGHPIMITPLAQFVGVQAAMNVIAGERYKEVSDHVILYALGRYGQEAVTEMDRDVRAKILDRSQARKIQEEEQSDLSIEELKKLNGGSHISDEELMFRLQVDEEMRRKLVTPTEYVIMNSPVVSLVQELTKTGNRRIHLTRPGMTLSMGRAQSAGATEAAPAGTRG